jgi:hypothetical protein
LIVQRCETTPFEPLSGNSGGSAMVKILIRLLQWSAIPRTCEIHMEVSRFMKILQTKSIELSGIERSLSPRKGPLPSRLSTYSQSNCVELVERWSWSTNGRGNPSRILMWSTFTARSSCAPAKQLHLKTHANWAFESFSLEGKARKRHAPVCVPPETVQNEVLPPDVL